MKKKFSIFLVLLVSVAMVASLGGCSKGEEAASKDSETASDDDQLKVALLVNGPISDAGWNASAYEGLKAIEKEFNAKVSYVQVKSLSDCEQELRAFADEGYDIVFGHGFEYQDPAASIHEEYPDTHFIIVSGSKPVGDNVTPLIFLEEQGYYVMGMAAAELTKTNKVGLIGGMEIPSLVYPWKGFQLGVKETKPEVDVTISWMGNWDDVGKAKEAAMAQIETGNDVVFISANAASLGGIEAMAEKNVWTFGAYGEQIHLAPNVMIGELLLDIPVAFTDITRQIVEGTWAGGIYSPGVAEGAVVFNWNDKLIGGNSELEAIREKGEKIMEDIKTGKKKIPSYSLEY